MNKNRYDMIVVGGGHGGCEAALAGARMGIKVALLTPYLDTIAMMSCNPSIGGPGKSHLVAELDILGGQMGRHIDDYNLQLKHLNTSKGPAARITRGQADKYEYRKNMKDVLEREENVDLIQEMVDELIVEDGKVRGVVSALGIKYFSKSVVLATGTFLKGRVVIGDVTYPAGRQGEGPSNHLSDSLIKAGIKLDRYQTATPPRIDMDSVDFSKMKELHGEENPRYFSLFTKKESNQVVPTWLTYTSKETIDVAKKLLKYSPIVTKVIETHGPRHCPSLDRKVLNFPDKVDHQIFLELESKESNELYVNGFTTAMPPFAQEEMLRTIKGLENAKIVRHGYAVEYDYAPAYQLYPTLESKVVKGLFLGGQINGTSGYEEAAVQGFIAGVNGAKKALGMEMVTVDRSEGYIGVLIDDIIHKETPEPYRVLPSRAEYRLTLRFDNTFMRLLETSKKIGILDESRIKYLEDGIAKIEEEIRDIKECKVPMVEANKILEEVGEAQRLTKGVDAGEILKFKKVSYDDLHSVYEVKELEDFIKDQVEVMIKYEVFIDRERKQIQKHKELESVKIPSDFDYESVKGISNIARDGLERIRPLSIGEASRISGVTGSDISLLLINLKK